MDGLMMDRPLLIKRLLWRAEHVFGDREVVTRVAAGYHRYSYAQFAGRVRLLAGALRGLGIGPGDRIATLAWNTYRHLECYFAVPGIGAVLHTANNRLPPEQLAYTLAHAQDRVVFVDADLVGLAEQVADRLPAVRTWVVLGEVPGATTLEPVISYDELLAAGRPLAALPEFEEDTASGLCYTSGTTGDPKGVVYSHRSTVLHSLALCVKGSVEVGPDETILTVTPMSHVNSWGIPYACALQGARLVLPGVHPRPEDLLRIIHDQRPTTVIAAVTVGTLMKDAWAKAPELDLSSMRRLWLGGQAPPRGLMQWWEEHNGTVVPNGWGMTETSPLATFCAAAPPAPGEDPERRYARLGTQGIPLPLVELRIVDDEGVEQPWDGTSTGELEVRAPWAARDYFDDPRAVGRFRDGWLRTGDVSVVYPDGSMQLKDRSKDLIKSGGEWIPSVELENALMAHPLVREAVVIAVADPTWQERPLACVQTSGEVTAEELREHLAARFVKFWVPDQIVFVHDIPKTSVGKFDKKRLRASYAAEGLTGIGAL